METTALDRLNIHIGKGEFVAVMGPSGCGKSTLLNIVGMIDSPSSGEYWFNDEEVGSRSENELVDVRKQWQAVTHVATGFRQTNFHCQCICLAGGLLDC